MLIFHPLKTHSVNMTYEDHEMRWSQMPLETHPTSVRMYLKLTPHFSSACLVESCWAVAASLCADDFGRLRVQLVLDRVVV